MCSVVLRPAVKPACLRRRWLWKVGLMNSKRIIANSFPGMESRVMPGWFEHTSLFPLFFQKGRMIHLRQSSRMIFLIHTMLIMYASHLTIESPPFLSSAAVMEQMSGARLFLRRLKQSSTSRLVTGSVCESAPGVSW